MLRQIFNSSSDHFQKKIRQERSKNNHDAADDDHGCCCALDASRPEIKRDEEQKREDGDLNLKRRARREVLDAVSRGDDRRVEARWTERSDGTACLLVKGADERILCVIRDVVLASENVVARARPTSDIDAVNASDVFPQLQRR